MHRIARAFGRAAGVYDRTRPGYSPAAVEWLTRELDLRPGRTVVDLAAGTGKLTAQLLDTGARVIAVEPSEGMMAILREAASQAESIEGTAEDIPLPSSSADAVVVAQAFHWFANDAAVADIHRVLRPGGVFGARLEQARAEQPGARGARARDRPVEGRRAAPSLRGVEEDDGGNATVRARSRRPSFRATRRCRRAASSSARSRSASWPPCRRRSATRRSRSCASSRANAEKPIILPHICELYAFRRAPEAVSGSLLALHSPLTSRCPAGSFFRRARRMPTTEEPWPAETCESP